MIRQKVNISYISYDEKDEEYILKFIKQSGGTPLGELIGLAMVNYVKSKESDKVALDNISEKLGTLTDTVKETSEKTSRIVVESSKATREHMKTMTTEIKDVVDNKSVSVPVTELEYILTQYSKLTDEMKQIVLENKRYNKALAGTVVKQQGRLEQANRENDFDSDLIEDIDDSDEVGDYIDVPKPATKASGIIGKLESAKEDASAFLKSYILTN